MALSAKLELRQGQQLVMTPQLQQAIRLLQLSNIELTEFVEAELERNPLLEREETTSSAKPADEPQTDRAEEPTGEGADDRWLDLDAARQRSHRRPRCRLRQCFPRHRAPANPQAVRRCPA